MAHDLVIRGGLIADGRGGEPVPGDVAVDGGTIVAVGAVPDRGTEEIDARDHLVTPGFVDIHTHYDGQATWDSSLASSSWHGVTTVVMGNCGVGFAPVRPDAHGQLISLMEGVEDIPGPVLEEGIDYTWETFGQYLDALEGRLRDIDVATQLPHGALRLYVMGDRATRLEEATEEDAAQMRRIATEAMRAGALGFSTSRTLNHRTATGDPTPSLRATAYELETIVAGVAEAGHGVVQMISDFMPDIDTEFELIRHLVAETGRPLSLSLGQDNRYSEAWRVILDKVEEAVADGLPISVQVAPRPGAVLLGLQSSFHPFIGHEAYQPIAHLPVAEQARAMRNPNLRAALLDGAISRRGRRPIDFSRVFPLGDPPDYEPPRETSVEALAAARGIEPIEMALDLLIEDQGRAFLFAPFSNYAEFNLDVCREMLTHKDAVLALSDGGAHVGIICDASFPTYALSHWGRDRDHDRIGVGRLVEQLSSRTARAVGLLDRGEVAVGMKADLNVIDFERLVCERPVMSFDLPSGGKRLLQRARGYAATVVSGRVIAREDRPTGALPGRLVRGPQADPRLSLSA